MDVVTNVKNVQITFRYLVQGLRRTKTRRYWLIVTLLEISLKWHVRERGPEKNI